jgi:hypothetical protein
MGVNKQRFENDERSRITQKFADDGMHDRKAAVHIKISDKCRCVLEVTNQYIHATCNQMNMGHTVWLKNLSI